MTSQIYTKFTDFYTEVMGYWSKVASEGGRSIGSPKVEIKRGYEAIQIAKNTQLDFIVLGGSTLREQFELFCNFGSLATDSQVDQKRMREFFLTLTQPSPAPSTQENDENTGAENKENIALNRQQRKGMRPILQSKGKGKSSTRPLRDRVNPVNDTSSMYTEADHKKIRRIVPKHLTFGSILNDSNWWIFRNDCFMIGAIQGDRQFHLSSEDIPPDHLLWDSGENRPRVLGRELIMLEMMGYQRIDGSSDMGIVFAPPIEGTDKSVTLRQYRDHIAQVQSVEQIKEVFNRLYENSCARSEVHLLEDRV